VADGPLDEIRAKSGRVRYVVTIQETAGKIEYRGRGAPPKKGEVEDALGKLDGVKKMSELPTDERAHAYEVVSEQDVDLRPDLFKLIADKGWVMLELHRDAQSLEDVFRNLTIGDERRNRHLSAEGTAQKDDDEDDNEDEESDDDDSDDGDSDDTDGDTKAAAGRS
jgi:ABC-2 type transport system ATP-binding protein